MATDAAQFSSNIFWCVARMKKAAESPRRPVNESCQRRSHGARREPRPAHSPMRRDGIAPRSDLTTGPRTLFLRIEQKDRGCDNIRGPPEEGSLPSSCQEQGVFPLKPGAPCFAPGRFMPATQTSNKSRSLQTQHVVDKNVYRCVMGSVRRERAAPSVRV
jgi:hypothetical protein